MAGVRLRPMRPLVGQGPWGTVVELGPEQKVGTSPAVALKGMGPGYEGHWLKQGAHPKGCSPHSHARAASLHGPIVAPHPPWLGVRPGQDPPDSWPWGQGLGSLGSAFLGFPGDVGRQGRSLPRLGHSSDPPDHHYKEHPSLLSLRT